MIETAKAKGLAAFRARRTELPAGDLADQVKALQSDDRGLVQPTFTPIVRARLIVAYESLTAPEKIDVVGRLMNRALRFASSDDCASQMRAAQIDDLLSALPC